MSALTQKKQSSAIDALLREAMGTDQNAMSARVAAQKALGLDDLNWNYFFSLYRNKMSGKSKRPIWIYEQGNRSEGGLIAYPVTMAPPQMLKFLRKVEYTDLKESTEPYDQIAKNSVLWVKKMQAGSGSSLIRSRYLSHRLGVGESHVRIGAKGTDLLIDIPDPENPIQKKAITLAEAQILQTIRAVERGELAEAVFHDLVSSETESSLREIWAKPALNHPSISYEEMIRQHPQLSHFGVTHQSFVPTLDQENRLSLNRTAPAGHAIFAVDALRAAYREELRPKTQRPLISAISNGEDLSSAPDPLMIGYVIQNRAPITLITTERSLADAKGGMMALLDEEGFVSLTVLETAQAKEAGQEALFSRLPGLASTNLTLFNYNALTPLLTREVEEIGEDELMKIISPDLISNVKEQRDLDGVNRKYLQLEGAMGSTIMNLDRYWRRKYGEPLVHLINVDRRHRTEFFSPVKSAFDYFLQFHSDHFAFDPAVMRIKNLRPGELPEITLKDPATGDKFYQDVENVLESFEGASLLNLDKLQIEGQVNLQGVTLRGNVRIINRGRQRADLRDLKELANVALEIGLDGKISRTGS